MSVSSLASETAIELARGLIRIASLTPVTPDLRPNARASLDYLRVFLGGAGADCQLLSFEGGHERWSYPVDNLYAEWGDPASPAGLCFLGHTDVVSPGDPALWTVDPYGAAIQSGYLFGRGATDMKGAVAAFVAAAATAMQDLPPARRPHIALLITTDEEWAAVNGTRRVLEWMKASGRRPSAFVVGEPSSGETFGSAIKVGRRGSLVGTLKAPGVQGHAAYPGLFVNPNRALGLALAELHRLRWDDAEPGMPATSFETIALRSGDFGASAIIPGEAEALWNIRFTPRQTPAVLTAKLQNLLDNPEHGAKEHADAILLRNIQLTANSDTAAMPYYSPPGALAALAQSIVAAHAGHTPVLDAEGGTTDGRFVHGFFPDAEIVELGLPEAGGLTRANHLDLFGRRGGMHQADECCAIADLEMLTDCYRDLVTAYHQRAA
jgi:succinyl-diaminopimelate desuccinylase